MIVVVDLRLRYLIKWHDSRFVLALQNRHTAKTNLKVQLSCERLLLPLMAYYVQMHKKNTSKAQTFGRAEVRT